MDNTQPASSSIRAIAFEGARAIGEGNLADVALLAKVVADRGENAPVLVFDIASSHRIELDLRGTSDDVLRRLAARVAALPETGRGTPGAATRDAQGSSPEAPAGGAPARRSPGRPRLGVVAREVTLLPRHWQWLATQPGGASVALRKLVEIARRTHEVSDRIRYSQESAWRFMQVMAAREASLEEASRALFASNADAFERQITSWPPDVAAHTRRLAAPVFTEKDAT